MRASILMTAARGAAIHSPGGATNSLTTAAGMGAAGAALLMRRFGVEYAQLLIEVVGH